MDLRTFAREAAMPQCCLYTPGDERNPTATVDGIEIASWPLSPDTVAALTTKHAGRVPADDVTLHDFYHTRDYVDLKLAHLLGGPTPQLRYEKRLSVGYRDDTCIQPQD